MLPHSVLAFDDLKDRSALPVLLEVAQRDPSPEVATTETGMSPVRRFSNGSAKKKSSTQDAWLEPIAVNH